MTALAQALSAALLHFLWQGSLVAVVLWVALFGLRKRPAAWRYAASCAALAMLTVLPLATVWILTRGAAGPLPSVNATASFFATAAPHVAGPVSWLARVESWALPVWSLGVLFLSIRLIWGAGQLYRLRRRGEPAASTVIATVDRLAVRLRIGRPVAVWISSLADGPSVVGWIRPLILLPSATLLCLTPEQLEAVLAHELAHIRRFDYAVNLMQLFIETLLFYHPAVWWVSARIRHERELCCDDLAVESCGNALCYARALTRLERLRLVAPGMAMAATGGPLLYRVQRLMGAAGPEYRPSRLPAILAVCVGLGCLALNMNWAKAQEQPKPQTQQKAATVTITRDGATSTVTLNNGVAEEAKPVPGGLFWMAADQGNIATAVYRVRGTPRDRGIQIDTSGAAVVKREPVEYPGAAIEKNIQGTVTVEAILDATGDVSDAHVLAGPQELRKAALQSVLEWRFQPAAAGTSRQVNITFQIPPGGFPKEPEEEGRLLLRGQNVGFARKATIDQSKATVRFLEEQVSLARQVYQGQLPAGANPEAERKYEDLVKRLEEARLAAEVSAGALKDGQDSAQTAIGRTVKNIDTRGLPEGRRTELVSRLQIHLGDTLTAASLERLETAVSQYDERLVVAYALSEGGQVGIRIGLVEGGEPGWVHVRQ